MAYAPKLCVSSEEVSASVLFMRSRRHRFFALRHGERGDPIDQTGDMHSCIEIPTVEPVLLRRRTDWPVIMSVSFQKLMFHRGSVPSRVLEVRLGD